MKKERGADEPGLTPTDYQRPGRPEVDRNSNPTPSKPGRGLGGIVQCAGGLMVAQRGTEIPPNSLGWQVGEVAPVAVPDSTPVISQRSDGVIWRRHWSERETLVIDFVDLARAEVDDRSARITFDRVLSDEMEEHLIFDHILPLALATRGSLVLHGGVISLDRHAAVLVGATGSGKSTLTAFAWQRGWTVGGDDGAVLHTADPPVVEPTYATIRLSPASMALLGIDESGSTSVIGKKRIEAEGAKAFSQERVELNVIVIIEPVPASDPPRFTKLDGIDAHARLFGATFHADFSQDRLLPSVLDRLAKIVETTTVGRLSVPRGRTGLEGAEQKLRTLVGA